ncbi:MAG: hypothetical protein KF688_08420 [Pirellulales bacterium]|nr:hypothetical protein [Pirellulales bacterium]
MTSTKSYATFRVALNLSLAALWLVANPTRSEAYAPLSEYASETSAGFSVLVHRDVDADAELATKTRRELKRQLTEIVKVLPEHALVELRKVQIWVELNAKERGGAEYHVSRRWLTENGYNPAKTGGVEIANARNFVEWSAAAQPCMVLHELAHAWHFRVLGEDHAEIAAAYRNAMDRGLYDRVPYVAGGTQKAYATTNDKEYFAELSEAYYGKNDFFPFVRRELEKHDPQGFAAIRATWEAPVESRAEESATAEPAGQ